MSTDAVFSKLKQGLETSMDALGRQFGGIRAGRLSPNLLDNIKVEAYGQQMPVNQVATVTASDAKTLKIAPFDPTTIGAIEKAIQKSSLGINPRNDGKAVYLSSPPLTEERRKEFVKLAKQHTEDCRVSQRNHRHEALDALKKLEKEKKISQDDQRRGNEQVQKLIDEYGKKIDAAFKRKEAEILEV